MMAEELYATLRAAYDADTGANGLANSASSGYVRNFVRALDTNDRSNNWPIVRVEIVEQEGDPFGKNRIKAVVKFHVFTKALTRFVDQGAVLTRLRTVYHKVTPAAGSTWSFGQMGVRGGVQVPVQDQDELHYVMTAKIEGGHA